MTDFNQMTSDDEFRCLKTAMVQANFSFMQNGECNAILREEYNDEVLAAFEQEHSHLAYPNGEDESADYSALNNSLFDSLLTKIVEEQQQSNVDVLLLTDGILDIVREELYNEMLEAYEQEQA